jgi:hypothetical protein
MPLEVKPDFTVELSIGGKARYSLPLSGNRKAYAVPFGRRESLRVDLEFRF